MVGTASDWSTVINFEVLGAVTAREGDWEADLQLQQRVTLTALVLAGGRIVSSSELRHAVRWDEMEEPPERGIKQVVSELRKKLSQAPSPLEIQAGGNGAYKLSIQSEQADVLRFRALLNRATGANGSERTRLMREALDEWPDAVDLYGGYPLSGLDGSWVDNVRWRLQQEHREAVMQCLQHDLAEGQHEAVMRECLNRTDGSHALGDAGFLDVWMRAAYLSGDPGRALQIFSRADDLARSSTTLEQGGTLAGLADRIRRGDPSLGVPGARQHSVFAAGPGIESSPISPPPVREVSSSMANQRTAASGPSITFNIASGAHVGNAMGNNDGYLTIHMGTAFDSPQDLGSDGGARGADSEGRR